MKFLSKFYIGLVFLILYAPILVVVLFSFNESGNLGHFSTFTLYWYQELFEDEEALDPELAEANEEKTTEGSAEEPAEEPVEEPAEEVAEETAEEAVEEANWVADIIDQYSINYPVAYDCEGYNEPDSRQHDLSKK